MGGGGGRLGLGGGVGLIGNQIHFLLKLIVVLQRQRTKSHVKDFGERNLCFTQSKPIKLEILILWPSRKRFYLLKYSTYKRNS